MTIVADTGALYALVDSSDAWHRRVLEWWRVNTDDIIVPVCVMPELCYLLHSRISPEAESAFVRSVADGEFTIEPLETEDIVRASALMRKYSDLELGFVDSALVATAERLDAVNVLTTDRRHFSAVRPRHTGSFNLSP